MFITKADGLQEEFNPDKLRNSLTRAGAGNDVIENIVEHIEGELEEGMSTSKIYRHAFEVLKRNDTQPTAARYSLRRAMMGLGPSGFAFESLLAEVFRSKGYEAETGVYLDGKCVEHEVDVVAQKGSELVLVEAKFHNRMGFKTDLKVSLYIDARAKDLQHTQCDGHAGTGKEVAFWLVTNTKFTRNAIRYGKCAGLTLVGWNYPRKNNLQDMIEEAGLHPLSCLTTLSGAGKQQLFKEGVVLCRDIKDNEKRLRGVGLSQKETQKVLNEAKKLCIPR